MSNKPTTYTRNEPNKATLRRIIDALATMGDTWITGKDIAKAMGRKQLWNSDRGVLARLVADGTLESRVTQVPPTLVARIDYRVIGKLPGTTE